MLLVRVVRVQHHLRRPDAQRGEVDVDVVHFRLEHVEIERNRSRDLGDKQVQR
jgi:hypothetical protein